MEKLHYYFSWIVSLQNRDKSEMPLLDTKQSGSKLLPQSDLQGWGEMLLEEVPRTTMYGRTAHNKQCCIVYMPREMFGYYHFLI